MAAYHQFSSPTLMGGTSPHVAQIGGRALCQPLSSFHHIRPFRVTPSASRPSCAAAAFAAGDGLAHRANGSHDNTILSNDRQPRPEWARLVSPLDSEIFSLAIPALFSTLLDPFMGVVDTAIVGRLGTAPLAAVGLATVLYNFSNFIWNFLLYTTTPRIAAAASRNDKAGVSAITAQGLWVAAAAGTLMTILLWNQCPALFAGMGASPAVMAHAVPYLRGRCIASPAILMFYVLAGTFRGYKDTRTPLMAGVVSNIIHFGLDIAFIFWLGWGVKGAALATSLSHWLTLVILGTLVVRKGYLRLEDVATPPTVQQVAPMLRNGLLLSTRNMLAMAILMWATKLITGVGAVALAAHEILRQIWVFSNQTFTSLDIATQSLVAFYLGKGDRKSAADICQRTLALCLVTGVVIAATLLATRDMLPTIFTGDAAVIAKATFVLPLIAAFMPLDAAASVMDGVLLGTQDAGWMSRTMIGASSICAVGLLICQKEGLGLFATWCVIKLLTVGRLIGNSWRLWSRESPLGEYLRPFWRGEVQSGTDDVSATAQGAIGGALGSGDWSDSESLSKQNVEGGRELVDNEAIAAAELGPPTSPWDRAKDA